jgi:hypothetical protein
MHISVAIQGERSGSELSSSDSYIRLSYTSETCRVTTDREELQVYPLARLSKDETYLRIHQEAVVRQGFDVARVAASTRSIQSSR